MTTAGLDHGNASVHPSGKIGPNSLIQTVRAMRRIYGDEKARRILEEGGQGFLWDHHPGEMIDEGEFITLARMLYSNLGVQETLPLLRLSGNLTGEYVLANRIPKFAQRIIKFLPRKLRLKVMLNAIGKNAWTFAGSGKYSFTLSPQLQINLDESIIRHAISKANVPVCSYYTGAFETLLKTLVDAHIQVEEIECAIRGDSRCVFQIKFTR
ncbi:MAG: bacteriochlorophyll 4-vinyl reductase [Chloroflexi bacterium]|uniref:Bacteriochlorophyll 4-vinyl reductase n=1 Tax=Candidatus Chlorohelix allophototropha TaxID=3003348 RepID=A0A8T7M1D8_9CHLR|nr:bacteriochlorophyll 4-vinyl reductase [Chloroflexota bacterium]WJW67675.1 bacteriochlorophyll 4-vinyl reductase [Chloroflexota bacterium L227-S17]